MAIPDRRLTPAQVEALDALKSRVAEKNLTAKKKTTIVITVVT
jgi:hypothetical protein